MCCMARQRRWRWQSQHTTERHVVEKANSRCRTSNTIIILLICQSISERWPSWLLVIRVSFFSAALGFERHTFILKIASKINSGVYSLRHIKHTHSLTRKDWVPVERFECVSITWPSSFSLSHKVNLLFVFVFRSVSVYLCKVIAWYKNTSSRFLTTNEWKLWKFFLHSFIQIQIFHISNWWLDNQSDLKILWTNASL